MSNDTCDGCGSGQLIDFHDRGEVICADCGGVKEVNLEASCNQVTAIQTIPPGAQLTWIRFERLETPIKSR